MPPGAAFWGIDVAECRPPSLECFTVVFEGGGVTEAVPEAVPVGFADLESEASDSAIVEVAVLSESSVDEAAADLAGDCVDSDCSEFAISVRVR